MDDSIYLNRYLSTLKNSLSKLPVADFVEADNIWSYEKQIYHITMQYARITANLDEITDYLSKKENLSCIETRLILDSPLPDLLKSNLDNDSLIDISRNIQFYTKVIKLSVILAKFRELDQIFTGSHGLWMSIQNLYTLSKKWNSLFEMAKCNDQEIVENIASAYKNLKRYFGHKRRQSNSIMTRSPYYENLFRNRLKDIQIQEYDMVDPETGTYNHSFDKEIMAGSISNVETRILIQEIGSMIETLPLNQNSSIFVCIDSNRIDVIKAIITGPPSTPYENGCFLFDIHFPQNYPSQPPHVKLKTTGHGRVRFNPNLYEDGKVCLSLLGTWTGAQSEVWSPHKSSLLQILVSIQSLIMNQKPFFNEPGYEIKIGTEEGEICSNEYNRVIRNATMKWALLDMMQNPPKEFEKVLLEYFRCKKYDILDQCEAWAEKSGTLEPIHVKIVNELSLEKYNLE